MYLKRTIISALLMLSVIWLVEAGEFSSSSTFLQSEVIGDRIINKKSDIIIDHNDRGEYQERDLLWHKVYDIAMTGSVAIGYGGKVFYGSTDFAPVEAALYDLNSGVSDPQPIWTYQGTLNSGWFVAASETKDLFVGLNYLAADEDQAGDGYCRLYIWSRDSSTPVAQFDFSNKRPLSTEPLAISNDSNEIVIGLTDSNSSGVLIYVVGSDSVQIQEEIVIEGDVAQMIRVSEDGNLIGVLQGNRIRVYDRSAGRLRPKIRVDGATANFSMSGDGEYIVSGWEYAVIHKWGGDFYREVFRLFERDENWRYIHCMVSGDGSTAVLNSYRSDFRVNRVTLVNLRKSEIVWSYDYYRSVESNLQLIPAQSSISYDGTVFLIGNWGDGRENSPVAMLFERNEQRPIYQLRSSASVERTALSSVAPYYAVVAGKKVHMNQWGAGSNLFVIDTGIDYNYASFSGIVRDETTETPLSEVEVTSGAWIRTVSDQAGSYQLLKLIPGDYTLTATKIGYQEKSIEISVTGGEDYQQDISLNPLESANLRGRVVSDVDHSPVKRASVTLEGYHSYQAETNSDGDFEITDVYQVTGYELQVNHKSYNKLVSSVSIVDEDKDLGDLKLIETPFPVKEVRAEIDESENVAVSWSEPEFALLREFSYDSGVANSAVGFYEGTERSVIGSLYHYQAELLQISWHLGTPDSPDRVRLFVFGLNEDGFPDSSQPLYISEEVVSVKKQWNVYDLREPLYAEQGFLIAISSARGGHLGLSVDNESSVKPYSQFFLFDYATGADFSMYMRGNYLLRALGYDYGRVVYPEFMSREGERVDIDTGYEMTLSYRLASVEMKRVKVVSPSWFKAYDSDKVATNRTDNETINPEEYLVFRFNNRDRFDQENWELLGSTTGREFIDSEWSDLPDGLYRYGVVTHYRNKNESESALSNLIDRGFKVDLFVSVSTNTTDSSKEVKVTLSLQEAGQNISYESKTDESGEVWFREIFRGLYEIKIELFGFGIYQGLIELADKENHLSVELIELLLPVRNLSYSVIEVETDIGVTLEWDAPITASLAESKAGRFIDYDLFRNEELIVTGLKEESFTDFPAKGMYQYGVRVNYESGSSPIVTTPLIDLATLYPKTELQKIYPNPFNQRVNILFSLEESTTVKIDIFNLQGRQVRRLLNGELRRGVYRLEWGGIDYQGRALASGVYLLRMSTDNYAETRKMLYLK